MSDVYGLGAPGFSYISTGETQDETQPAAPSGDGSTLKKSDKELIEELVAMLPKSWIDPTLATNLWQNIDSNLGLIADRASIFSAQQSSIVMAGLASWGKSLDVRSEALKEDIKREETDPLIAAVKRYIKHGGQNSSIDSIDLFTMIRTAPILASSLQAIDPALFNQAFKVAEQEITQNILTRWISAVNSTTINTSISLNLLDDYLDDVKTGKQTLNQPVLSIVIAGVIGGSQAQVSLLIDPVTGSVSIDPTKDSLLPTGQNVMLSSLNSITGQLPSDVQAALSISMAQILTNTTNAASYFSIPGALSLAALMPPDAEGTSITKASASSYALTISQFVLRPEFDAFIKCAILKNVPLDQIPQDKLDHFIAAIKVLLLANALAALDKVETGGVIIRAADIQTLLDGKSDPSLKPGDLRLALATDINTLLATLPDGGKQLKSMLLSYFDTNPKVETMIDPSNAFLALSDPTFFRQVSLQQRG